MSFPLQNEIGLIHPAGGTWSIPAQMETCGNPSPTEVKPTSMCNHQLCIAAPKAAGQSLGEFCEQLQMTQKARALLMLSFIYFPLTKTDIFTTKQSCYSLDERSDKDVFFTARLISLPRTNIARAAPADICLQSPGDNRSLFIRANICCAHRKLQRHCGLRFLHLERLLGKYPRRRHMNKGSRVSEQTISKKMIRKS